MGMHKEIAMNPTVMYNYNAPVKHKEREEEERNRTDPM